MPDNDKKKNFLSKKYHDQFDPEIKKSTVERFLFLIVKSVQFYYFQIIFLTC